MKRTTLWLFVLFGLLQMNAQEFSIYNCSPSLSGSNFYGPMYTTSTANAASRMAVIYPAGQLVSIAGQALNTFYAERQSTGTSISGTPNFRVLLKEVTMSDWGSEDLNWDAATTDATVVYDSDPATIVGSTDGWKAFPMSTPFIYSGTQNLAVFYEYYNTAASGNVLWKTDSTSPCLVAGSTNATKYSNSTSGVLPTTLPSEILRRPIIGFGYVNSCAKPTAVTVNGITSTGANLSWTAGGSEAQWEYALVEAGMPITSALTTVTSSNTVSNIVLNPNTAYEFFVRAICGTDVNSVWSGSGRFSTPCNLVTSFVQNFDTYTAGITNPMPDCWNKLGTGSVYVNTGSTNPNSTPNRLTMTVTASTTEALAILPSVSSLQANTHRLRMSVFTNTTGNVLEIGYLTSLNNLTSFNSLQNYTINATTSATAQTIIFQSTDFPVGIQNIVIRNNTTTSSKSFHLDDVVWELIPACADLTNLEFIGSTDTSANVSWISGNNETEWQYVYSPNASANPNDLTTTTVTGTTGTLTQSTTLQSLTSNTVYNVWVRSICPLGGFGIWVGPLKATTLCSAVTNYSENFDSYAAGTAFPLPNCWSKIVTGAANAYISAGNVSPNSAPNRLQMSANGISTPPTKAYVIMPVVNNLQAGTHRLKLNAFASLTQTVLSVGYFSIPNESNSFQELESVTLTSTSSATAQSLMFEFDNTLIPAGVTNLVFAHTPTVSARSIYIDDVIWEATPGCSDIVSVTSQTVTTNTATVSWVSDENDTDWQYVYALTSVTDPATLTPTDVTGTASTIIPGLEPSTSYKVWIRTNCGSGAFGLWSQPIVVTTLCALKTEFFEDFESYTAGTTSPMPTCWAKTGTNGVMYIRSGSGIPIAGLNSLYMYSNSGAPTICNAVLPEVSNLQNGTHRLRFKAYSSAADRTLLVGYFSDSNDTSTFNTIETINLPNGLSNGGQEFTVVPTDVPDGVYSLVIRNEGYPEANYQNTSYIDDVTWEAIPTCVDIAGLTATNISDSSAEIQWTSVGTELGWQYVYAPSTVTDPDTLTPITATTTTAFLTELTSNTPYTYWVRSTCGGGSFGNWSIPYSFKTLCGLATSFSENFDAYATGATNPLPDCWTKIGDGSTYIFGSSTFPLSAPNKLYLNSNGATVACAILPPVSNLQAGTHRLKFSAYSSGVDNTIEIGYLTDLNNASSFVSIETYVLPTGILNAASFTFIPNATFQPGVTSLVIRNAGTTGNTTVYIDDVNWDVLASCANVTGLSLVSSTDTTANISWETTGAETGWQYAYAPATVISPIGLTTYDVPTNVATITGLTAMTTYNVWVRSTCGTSQGEWSLPITFTTQCEPIATLPWTEGFESIVTTGTGVFPTCWLSETTKWSSANTTSTIVVSPNTGTKYIRCSDAGSNSNLWTPPFHLVAGQSYDFSFYAQGDGWNGWIVNLFYNSIQSSTGETAFGTSFEAPGIGSTSLQEHTLVSNTFVAPTTGTYYFKISVSQPLSTPFFIGFDDFKLDSTLGTGSFDSSSFVSYPNPVNDILNLSYSETISDVSVFNLLGQKVITTQLNASQGQINMSQLAAGTYLVKVASGNQIKTLKVIKN